MIYGLLANPSCVSPGFLLAFLCTLLHFALRLFLLLLLLFLDNQALSFLALFFDTRLQYLTLAP